MREPLAPEHQRAKREANAIRIALLTTPLTAAGISLALHAAIMHWATKTGKPS